MEDRKEEHRDVLLDVAFWVSIVGIAVIVFFEALR